jgi:hypothetical protein
MTQKAPPQASTSTISLLFEDEEQIIRDALHGFSGRLRAGVWKAL